MPDEIRQNIDRLSKIPAAGDPDNAQALREWEEKLHALEVQQEYASNDITKMIAAKLRERIATFTGQLAFSETLKDDERRFIWAQRREDLWLISLLNPDVERELKTLSTEVRKELEL